MSRAPLSSCSSMGLQSPAVDLAWGRQKPDAGAWAGISPPLRGWCAIQERWGRGGDTVTQWVRKVSVSRTSVARAAPGA
jgi:hypothetical protein